MTIRRGQDAHREEESKDLAEMNNEEPDFWWNQKSGLKQINTAEPDFWWNQKSGFKQMNTADQVVLQTFRKLVGNTSTKLGLWQNP